MIQIIEQLLENSDITDMVVTLLLPVGAFLLNKLWVKAKETAIGTWLSAFGLEAATQRTYDRFKDEIKAAREKGKLPKSLVEELQNQWYREIVLLADEKFGVDITKFYSGSILAGLREVTVTRLQSMAGAKEKSTKT